MQQLYPKIKTHAKPENKSKKRQDLHEKNVRENNTLFKSFKLLEEVVILLLTDF